MTRGYRRSSATGRRYGADVDFPWIRAALIGTTAGFLSGLLGLGGGVIVVPGLVLLLGLNQYSAAATSVATIVVSTVAALVAFSGGATIDWATAGIVFVGSAAGAWAGARWIHKVPEHVLAGTLALLMAAASIRMWF